MIKEFREFIDKGSFIEVAVGFVMGLAFNTVVTTLVDRVINPAIGLVFDMDSLDDVWTFGENGSVGAVIGALTNFVVVAFFLFLVVKAYNKMKREEDAGDVAPPEPGEDIVLLREIRDSLVRG